MSYHTFTALTQAVIQTVGLVSGTSVQTYTEPNIKKAIQQTSDMIFRKENWPHLCEWITVGLDGVTGRPTSDLSDYVHSWEAIRDIVISGTDQRVVRSLEREHLHVSGASPLYFTPIRFCQDFADTRMLKFWPITATGNVDMFIKERPDEYAANDDIIPFPKDVMEYGTAWNVMANDGINPDATERCRVLYEVAYQDWYNEQFSTHVGHGRRVRRRDQFVMGNTL